MANLLVTQGTQSALPVDAIGTVNYPYAKLDVGAAGASSPWQGTVRVSVGTMSAGTVNTGTVNTGTVNTGTIDAISQLPPANWATVINVAVSTFGTIKAAVAGSQIFVTDLTINTGVVGGTVAIYSGSTGNPIAGTWSFNLNGGISQNYRIPLATVSGSALTYQQQGTAALSINVQGYVK